MRRIVYETCVKLLISLSRAKHAVTDKLKNDSGENIGLKDLGEDEKNAYVEIKKILPEAGDYKRSTVLLVMDHAKRAGAGSLAEYAEYLKENEEERVFLKNNLTLKGTHFFRGDDWGEFERICVSSFNGKKDIKVWCAGCSYGKEVYSVIMMLLEYAAPEDITVLATDIDENMIRECRAGSYPLWQLKEVPQKYWKYTGYSKKGHPNSKKKIFHRPYFTFRQDILDMITVRKHDLLKDPYPEGFDLILCRNVIKFFSPENIISVRKKLAASLNKGGYLFLSRDGEGNDKEIIADPETIGLIQPGNAPVYRKI